MALNFPSNPAENDIYQFGLLTYVFKNGKWVSQSRGASQLPWYSNMEQARALWKRLAAEAGLNLVDGSFEEGAEIASSSDAVWWQAGSAIYNWHLNEAKTIPAGSTPATTGGIGAGAWVDRTDVTLRSSLLAGAIKERNGVLSLRDIVSVKDFGAVGDGVTDDSDAIDAAVAYVTKGAIFYPVGTYRISRPIIVKQCVYHIGSGTGGTIIKPINGSNTDVFKTDGFDALTATGPLNSAPKNFGVLSLQVDGNYLADWRSASIGGDTTINNTGGFGVKIFGSKYTVDIEINNCAQVGFYSEAVDYTGYGDEQECFIRLVGRVFGKEAFIYRGPADVYIDEVMMGAVGWLPTESERQSTIVMSDIYPASEVAVAVTDEQSVGSDSYHGHHEFGFMHLYGNRSGYGYRAENTGRLKGNHMICENCRGGFMNSTRTWGSISVLECHSNGVQPSEHTGTLDKMYDILDLSLQAFNVNAIVRRTIAEQEEYTAYRTTGKNGRVTLDYFVAGSSVTGASSGNMAEILSSSKTIDINCVNTSGNAVYIDGIGNNVKINSRNHFNGALVKRVGNSGANLSNNVTINANNCAALLYLDGLVTTEQFNITGNLNAGQTIYESGSDAIDMYFRGVLTSLAVRIGSSFYASKDAGRVNLDNTVTTAQTITITHNYFQSPDPSQVSFSLYDPSPNYSGAVEYIYLQSVSSTSLTFTYKLSAVGTGGPLVLCWKID